MKKILVLMLAGSMALSLVACGATADTAEPESVVVEEPSVVESVEEVPATIPEEPTTVEEETEEEATFTTGEIVNGVYENPMIGIRYTLGDAMEFASEERLAELSASTADVLKDDKKVAEELKNGNVMIVCYASTDENAIPVFTFNITLQTEESLKKYGEYSEEIILQSAMNELKPTFESYGFENIEMSLENAEFLGEEHPCLYMTADLADGRSFVEREFVIIKNGYAASYTASIIGGDKDTTMDILNNVELME